MTIKDIVINILKKNKVQMSVFLKLCYKNGAIYK